MIDITAAPRESLAASDSRSEPVMIAQDLTRYYPVKTSLLGKPVNLKALDGVSFTLHEGKTLAVVGESGSGKSTLGRLLTMIERPTAGRLQILDVDVTHPDRATLKRMRSSVQMVFQNPYGSLNPRKKVGAILKEPLIINTSLSRAAREEAAAEMMRKVSLRPEHITRYPHMFSGGQRQRIAIARALMLHPKIVIADEPVSALDVSVRAQVLNLMMDLQDELRLAYLFISHDLSVVRHIADEVMVLYLGRPVEQGKKDDIFRRPRHPYTQALLSSTPSVDPQKKSKRQAISGELPSPLSPPSGCAFHKRCPFAKAECADQRPEPRLVDQRMVACHFAETIEFAS